MLVRPAFAVGTAATETHTDYTTNGSTVSANEEYNSGSGWTAWKVFNNDTGAPGWSSSPNQPDWIKYDFGEDGHYITNYDITPWENSWYPTDWQLQGSDNNTDWTDVDTEANSTALQGQGGQTINFTIDTPGSYRYYRLYLTECQNSSTAYCELLEMELYEETAPTPTPTPTNTPTPTPTPTPIQVSPETDSFRVEAYSESDGVDRTVYFNVHNYSDHLRILHWDATVGGANFNDQTCAGGDIEPLTNRLCTIPYTFDDSENVPQPNLKVWVNTEDINTEATATYLAQTTISSKRGAEICEDIDLGTFTFPNWLCQAKNFLVQFFTPDFTVTEQQLEDVQTALNDKAPFAYINAVLAMDLSDPSESTSAPTVTMTFVHTENGAIPATVEVAPLSPLTSLLSYTRPIVNVLLWLIFITYLFYLPRRVIP